MFLDKTMGKPNFDVLIGIASFCLQHNTTPSSNGSIPNGFIFLQSLRTRLSIQCTEADVPCSQIPAYVRVEGKKPLPATIQTRVGDNTVLDDRSRLVHESDVLPRLQPEEEETEQSIKAPISPATAAGSEDATSLENSCDMSLRRGTRVRTKPIRYGYD